MGDIINTGAEVGRVLLIRHAESEANAGAATESPHGIRLTERGHRQAAELAARFECEPHRIVVSPFLRTRQTAEPLIARFPLAMVEEWPVQEFTYLNPTLYAGTTESQRAVFAEAYWRLCDANWNGGGGAESFAEFIDRVDGLLARLSARGSSHTVVFTHGYFIKAIRLRLAMPLAKADDMLMAAFRDTRKMNPVKNAAVFALSGARSSARRLTMHVTLDGHDSSLQALA